MPSYYDYLQHINTTLCSILNTLQSDTLDPEFVCATNDGGETVIKLVAVYDKATNQTSLYNPGSGTVVTGYTVIPCNTSQGVIVGSPWCWAGTTILPFFDVETDGSASATVAFWFNPVANAVVVPDGSQVPGVCVNATPTESVTTNDCAGTDIIANIPQDRVVYTKPVKGILQSTKDCNSDISLATLQDIKINGDQSNTNELVANTELAAINANTDQIETLLSNTITELNDTQTLLQTEFDETQAQIATTNTILSSGKSTRVGTFTLTGGETFSSLGFPTTVYGWAVFSNTDGITFTTDGSSFMNLNKNKGTGDESTTNPLDTSNFSFTGAGVVDIIARY